MSVHIEIDEKTAITSDPYNWRISKRQKKKDGYEWVADRYYSSLSGLFKAELNNMIRASDAQSFAELLASVENATTALKKAVAPLEDNKLR